MAATDARLGARLPELNEPLEGFDGQLRCASLADLIQLQCGTRSRAKVSVRSEGREGHLFFDDGQIVHAVEGTRVGEEAVFEILNWTTGTFGQSAEPWPEKPSVTTTWQHLLLSSAQRRDELHHQGNPATSTSRLVAVRKAISSLPAPDTGDLLDLGPSLPRPARRVPTPAASTPRPPVKERPWAVVNALPSVVCAARFDAGGNALEVRGDGQRLLGLAVQVRRLAELMGENLGQEGFLAFECRSESTTFVLFADAPDSHVVVETTEPVELRALYRAWPP